MQLQLLLAVVDEGVLVVVDDKPYIHVGDVVFLVLVVAGDVAKVLVDVVVVSIDAFFLVLFVVAILRLVVVFVDLVVFLVQSVVANNGS
ncbi:hypothetical protein BDA99DRAFT_522581 [Phascolomyces articulosus]|uniref:Uncharacterized protein n=1 Tax=Phascolomyces articulosus TaxID=60185 RepID=A0AAD5JR16_9FUNG|nr:hypothetical protein BDA99DRAFT_522581 [Phascolomyces articulosus]